MSTYNKKSMNKILFAIIICISFFSYRVMEFCSNDIDHKAATVLEQKYESMADSNITSSYESIISASYVFDLDQQEQQSIFEVVSNVFDQFDEEDKGYSIIGLHKSSVFFVIPFMLMLLSFLSVRRWLIKTFHILKYYVSFVAYLHKKDGKKKCYPLYCQICDKG